MVNEFNSDGVVFQIKRIGLDIFWDETLWEVVAWEEVMDIQG